MSRPLLVFGLLVALAVLLLTAWWRSSSQVDPAPTGQAADDAALTQPEEADSEELQRMRQTMQAKTAELVDAALDPTVEPPVQQALRPGSEVGGEIEWPREYPRSNFPLADYFVRNAARWDHSLLVRHVALNPSDTPVHPDLVEELGRIVSWSNDRVAPLAEHQADTRRQEMVQHIEAGHVRPVDVPKVSDAKLRAKAESLARVYQKHDPTVTVDDLYEKLRAQRYGVITARDNTIIHAGVPYLHSSFDKLQMPATDEAFDALKMLCLETQNMVQSWFVGQQLCSEAEASGLLGEAFEKSRQDLSSRERR